MQISLVMIPTTTDHSLLLVQHPVILENDRLWTGNNSSINEEHIVIM